MKDKDFDDIGKRLHDLEADPPIDGWNNIKPELHSPPAKVVWLRKNWWKPLVILIPVSTYLFYSNGIGVTRESPSRQLLVLNEKPIADESLIVDTEKKERNSSKENLETTSTEGITLGDESISDDRKRNVQPPIVKNKNINIDGASAWKREASNDFKVDSENGSESPQKIVALSQNDVDNSTLSEGAERKMTLRDIQVEDSYKMNISVDSFPRQLKTEEIVIAEEIKQEELDSSTVIENEKGIKLNQWRLSASFTANYLTNSVRPVVNDEVLITSIDKSASFQKIGFGFAFGVGKAIAPNLFMDAQLSVMEVQQSPRYSYTTGNVDTLIAVLQPDQNILVTPVFKVTSQEISGKYKYAGIKVSLTYYFWATPRGRFNIMASAGTHYLFSSEVKSKIDGEWISLSNENLNKINYSGMIGAGYNLRLNEEWELMINPALTYFARDVKSEELPYRLTNQSLGLNIMLSKKLGLK